MNYYITTKDKIESEVKKINLFVSDFEWMFFEVREMNQSILHISGMLDELIPKYLFDIYFEFPHSVICPLTWEIEKTNKFIELDLDEGLIKMNTLFDVQLGNFVFKMKQSNIRETASDIYVAAKNIRMKVLDCTNI